MKISNTSERLQEVMRIMNLKQIDLVRITGLHKSTISYYVLGKREPAQDNIFLISNALGVEPAWLMGYDVPMKKEPTLDEKYNVETAELMNAVKNDERLRNIVKMFSSLTDAQKLSVETIILGMVGRE